MTLADAQIAGICLAGRDPLATRDATDVADVADALVINAFA